MTRNVQAILGGVLLLLLVLSSLARRFPHVDWLSLFRSDRPYDPEQDRKLDTAWMSAPGIKPRRNPFLGIIGEVRKEYQAIRGAMPQLPPEEKVRRERRSYVIHGLQLIALGVVLPLGFYIFKVMMFFAEVSRAEEIVVFTLAGVCVVLGLVGIWRGFTTH